MSNKSNMKTSIIVGIIVISLIIISRIIDDKPIPQPQAKANETNTTPKNF